MALGRIRSGYRELEAQALRRVKRGMELKRYSVPFRLALASVSLWTCPLEAQPPEGHEKGWSELNNLEPMTPQGGQALTRWIGTWLEPDAWPELPAFLDKQKPTTATGHLWLAEVWDRLAEPAKAASATLAALERTKGDTSRLRVEAGRRLARCAKFDDMPQVLEGLSPDAPAELLREALELRWQVSRTQGGTEQLLPTLRAKAEASTSAEQLLPEVIKWESMTRGQSDEKIAILREKLAVAKSPETRNAYRRLLVLALMNQRKMHDVYELAESWLAESAEGSEDERLATCALLRCLEAANETFHSAPVPALPSVAEIAGRVHTRRPVFQALLTWLIDQGLMDEALRLLDQHQGQAFPELRAELLTLTDRHAEAVALLQVKTDMTSQLRAALLMRDLGQSELAARALESRLEDGAATQADHESALAVMSLLRLPTEVAEWRAKAAAKFPQSHLLRGEGTSTAANNTTDRVDTRLKEIMNLDRPKQLAELLRLRRETKGDMRVARHLLTHYLMNQQHTQMWALARLMEVEADTSAARLDSWREVLWIYRSNASALQPRLDTVGPEFWIALVEVQTANGDNRFKLEDYLQKASQAAPQDAWLKYLRQESMLRKNQWEELGMIVTADDSPASRLMRARLLFRRNQPELAARELLLLATDPALDATQALETGLDMVSWRLFPEAEAFLQTQQSRFPDDARFTVLRALSLFKKDPGSREELALLLELGRFFKESPPSQNLLHRSMRQDLDGMNLQQNRPEPEVREIIEVAGRILNQSSDILLGSRINSTHQTLETILPQTNRKVRAWATARLMVMALELSAAERGALAAQAAAAGLPHAGLIELSSLSETRGLPMIQIDDGSLEAKLDQPAAASLWLDMRPSAEGYLPKLSPEQQARLPAQARQAAQTLQKANWHPHKRLEAARLWLNLEPASIDALKLYANTCSLPENQHKDMNMPFPLDLTLEQRRRPEWQAALSRLIQVWLASPQPMKHSRAAQGYASAGLWAEAAAQWNTALETSEAEQHRALLLAANLRSPSSFPSWLHGPSVSSPLTSPAFSQLGRLLGAQVTQPRHLAQVPEPLFRDQEKAAFMATADSLQNPGDRAAWMAASGDAAALKAAVEAWSQAEPASLQAVTAHAWLTWQSGAKTEALDRLRRFIPEEPGSAREEARMMWLRAVLFADSGRITAKEGLLIRPLEDAEQRKFAAAILREWLPLILKHRHEMEGIQTWQQVYESCGLSEEAARLNAPTPPTVSQQTRQGTQYWSPQPEDQEYQYSRLRKDSSQASFPKIDTSQKISPEKQAEQIARWLATLRWQADRSYLGEQRVVGYEMEQSSQNLIDTGLADELQKLAEPGRIRSWRALIHAAHVAEYCGDWAQARDLLTESTRLQKPNTTILSSLIMMEHRLAPDLSKTATRLLTLPARARKSVLANLMEIWPRAGDYSQRLDKVDLAIQVIQKEPSLLLSLNGTNRLSERLFQFLTEPAYTEKMAVPDFFETKAVNTSSENAASPALLARRQTLHNQLCDLILTQPPVAASMGNTVRSVLMRYLRDDVPETSAMLTWLRGLAPDSGTTPASLLMNNISHYMASPERLKLARLIMDLRAEEPTAPREQMSYFPSRQLAEMIGSGLKGKSASVAALWESPFMITEGDHAHSPEQQAWHRQRVALFEECWNSALKQERALAEVFPFWACWALHDEKRVPEVLRVARHIHGTPQGQSVIHEMVRMAESSYHKHQHIRVAELVETLLSEAKPSAQTQATTEMLRRLSVLLLAKERDMTPAPAQPDVILRLVPKTPDRGAQPSPPPASPPESAPEAKRSADTTEADLEDRKKVVYEKLLKRLGDTGAIPPEAGFASLEQALRTGADTAEIEKNLAQTIKTQRHSFEEALAAFIGKANTRPTGIWEPDLRLRWFAAAWRLGQPLLVGERDQMPHWLSLWVTSIQQSDEKPRSRILHNRNSLRSDIRNAVVMNQPNLLSPALAKMDELLLKVLNHCLTQELSWRECFYIYLEVQSRKQPQSVPQVISVIRQRMKEAPQDVSEGFTQWTRDFAQSIQPGEPQFLMALLEEIIASWPANQTFSDHEQARTWMLCILDNLDDGRLDYMNFIQLVPGSERWVRTRHNDNLPLSDEQKALRARWHQLLKRAAPKDGLLHALYVQFCQVHLETTPFSELAETGRRYLKRENAAAEFGFQLKQVFEEYEPNAPVSRRVVWGQLALALLPQSRPASVGQQSPVWLETMIRFISASPDEEHLENYPSLKASAADLTARDSVLTALRQQTLHIPEIAVETFGSLVLARMQSGEPVSESLILGRELIKKQPERFGALLPALCQGVPKDASPAQVTWILNLLVPLAEEWPTTEQAPYWLSQMPRLLVRPYLAMDAVPVAEESHRLFRRFITVVLRQQVHLQAEVLSYCDDIIANHPKQREWLTGLLEAQLREKGGVAALSKLMEAWWIKEASQRTAESYDKVILPVALLRNWPAEAKPESLAWTEHLLRSLSYPVVEIYPQVGERLPQPTSLAIPQNSSAARHFHAILKLLEDRQADFPWLKMTRLRLLCHTQTSLADRQRDLEPWFKPPLLAETLTWLDQALTIPTLKVFLGTIMGGAPPLDPHAEQALDAVRAAHTALQREWLKPETAAKIRDQVPPLLRQISALAAQGDTPRPGPWQKQISANYRAQADSLLDLWHKASGSTLGRPLTAPDLPARIHEGLRIKESSAALVTLVLEVVKKEPEAACNALESWANKMTVSSKEMEQWQAAGDFVAELASLWKETLPAPDWLVSFVHQWKKMKSNASKDQQALVSEAEDRVWPQVAALLEKSPHVRISDLSVKGDWFQAVLIARRWSFLTDAQTSSELKNKLVELAEARLRHAPQELISFPELSLPMMFQQRIEAGPVIYLLEHKLHSGGDVNLDLLRSHPRAAPLIDLYFCPAKNFPEAAEAYSQGRYYPQEWPLRVARLRGLNLDAEAWVKNISAYQNKAIVPHPEAVITWLAHFPANYSRRALLKSLIHSLTGPETDVAPLAESFSREYRQWLADASSSKLYKCFETPWDAIESLLRNLTRNPALFADALAMAEDTGMLSQRGLIKIFSPYVPGPRSNTELVMAHLSTSGLLTKKDEWPEPFWLRTDDDECLLWRLARLLWVGTESRMKVRKLLTEHHDREPSLAVALLLAATGGDDSARKIPVDFIESALTPHADFLKKQSAQRLSQLSASLLLLQPELLKTAATRPISSVLRLLPAPNVTPGTAAIAERWLAVTPATLPAGSNLEITEQFLRALRRLLDAESADFERVLQKGAHALSASSGCILLRLVANPYSSVSPKRETKWRHTLIRWILLHPEQALEVVARDEWGDFCEDDIYQLIRIKDGSSAMILGNLHEMLKDTPPGTALMLLPAIKKMNLSIPSELRGELKAKTLLSSEAQPDDLSLKVLAWIFAQDAFGEIRQINSPPTATLADLWPELKNLPAALRLSLAQHDPASVPANEAARLLAEWMPVLSGTETDQVMKNPVWPNLSSLSWLDRLPANDATTVKHLKNMTMSLIEEMKEKSFPTYRGIALTNFIQKVLNKLLHALTRAGLKEESLMLMQAAAKRNILTVEFVLGSLVENTTATRQNLLPHLYQRGERKSSYSGYSSTHGLPSLQKEHEAALKELDQPGELPAVLFLSALPDSAQSPPSAEESTRVSAVLSRVGALPDANAALALYPMLGVSGMAEKHLPALLPILRRLPSVISYQNRGSFASTATEKNCREILLWALAEALHGQPSKIWPDLCQKLEPIVPTKINHSFAAHFPPGMGSEPMISPWKIALINCFQSLNTVWPPDSSATAWERLYAVIAAIGPETKKSILSSIEAIIKRGIANSPNPAAWTELHKSLPSSSR